MLNILNLSYIDSFELQLMGEFDITLWKIREQFNVTHIS